MEFKPYEKIYQWEELIGLVEEFLPELVERHGEIRDLNVQNDLPEEKKDELISIGFSNEGKDSREVARYLVDSVYPYRMRVNHPRYFSFIPNHVSPYSIFGDFLNSMHNPYGGGITISEGTATIEAETIKWMGEMAGYDPEKLGGQFVSGGSMANLTALVVARDKKLRPEEFVKGTAYVSDQTHSSVAKAIHIMGIPRENVRKVKSDENFKMLTSDLVRQIEADKEKGFKPFLLVGSSGTTNTGSIDPLEELAEVAKEHDLWYHVDGAFGASALLSSHKELLRGIEKSDSLSWDGHKWLFQTYGCAAVICKDKMDLVSTFSVDPEYLKDVESKDDQINFWDMGIELTKPARGMRLWYTLQTVGLDAMRSAIDEGFRVADWFEEEVEKYDNFEIVSHSQMGIINFRFYSDKYTEEELDEINRRIAQRARDKKYAMHLTTMLNGKVVLRFCCISPLTTREEVKNIIDDIQIWIEEETK